MKKTTSKSQLLDSYKQRANKFSRQKQGLKKNLNVLIFLRLLTFLVMAYGTYKLGVSDLIFGLLFLILLFGVFIFIVRKHLKKKNYLRFIENLITVNRQEIEALRGNISNFKNGKEFEDPNHPYSNDLELFGDKNLFQYLNRTSTYSGKNKLANWLLYPLKNKEEIEQKQEAIKEIKEEEDWRQHLTAIGKDISMNEYDDARLISWSKEKHHLPRESFLRLFIYLSPLLILTGLTLYITNLLPIGYTIILLLINRGVLFKYSHQIMSFHQQVTNQLKILKNYSRLFRHIENKNFSAPNLKKLKQKLSTQDKPSSRVIQNLYRIIDAMDAGTNIFVEAIMNTIFLYNIHLVFRLEKWHSRNAAYIEDWLIVVGCFDAYGSLGNYYYNNPNFIFPVINEDTILEAKKMGHPLISDEKRVNNDFEIEKKGNIFIITGANMAGKSTFLRTTGVNLVLAMTGAPVCAEKMSFRITQLFTSMTITDSLALNQSYFYAEVKRLRQLIDTASSAENILVFLDEILTGTNTKDKEIASKAFLERLIKMEITSIIATHDLSLTTLEKQYPDKIKNNRFEVDLVGGKMKYDYTIREGIAQNMNALELLRNMKLIP